MPGEVKSVEEFQEAYRIAKAERANLTDEEAAQDEATRKWVRLVFERAREAAFAEGADMGEAVAFGLAAVTAGIMTEVQTALASAGIQVEL